MIAVLKYNLEKDLPGRRNEISGLQLLLAVKVKRVVLVARIGQLNKDYYSQILISEDVMHKIDHSLPSDTKFLGKRSKRMASTIRYIQDHIIKLYG